MSGLRIAVGSATAGRPAVLPEVLAELVRQTRPPDRLVVCHAVPGDVVQVPAGAAELIMAPVAGLAAQRNQVLDAVADCDAVVFFDDDFLPAPGWLAGLEALFQANSAVVAATGGVVADGVRGPGLSPAQGRALLAADRGGHGMTEVRNAYGCNMALRLAPMRAHGLRFDERLPLHGWFEDVDLTCRLARHGRVVRDDSLRGVHLGAKAGRGPGRRTGYSQIANPLHLVRKGSYPLAPALAIMARNLAMNTARSPWPEPWVDRRGRLAGNLRALADLMRGRLRPERILEL